MRQEQEPASTDVTEVAPGLYRFQLPISMPGLGHVNCYALEDADGFTVVDPGLPSLESWEALGDRLAQVGARYEHVHTAVVTHSHPDHFGGVHRLRDDHGTRVLTHADFRSVWLGAAMDDDLGTDDNAAEGFSFVVTVDDGEEITLGGRTWLAVHTPGHTHDHLCLFDPADGLLLSGDHVLPTITPHINGIGPMDDPLATFFRSLERMKELPGVTNVLPAHGHPFTDVVGRVDAILGHHEERLETIREAGDDLGGGTVESFMQRLFQERSWGDMAASETYAHLEHLRILGLATRDEVAGQAMYRTS